jgi:hypothetical protein
MRDHVKKQENTMSNITRIGLAAALVIGSASVALAQDYQSPRAMHAYRGYSAQQMQSETRPNVGPNAPYNYYENTSPDQPWSSSTDPGNTTGGG